MINGRSFFLWSCGWCGWLFVTVPTVLLIYFGNKRWTGVLTEQEAAAEGGSINDFCWTNWSRVVGGGGWCWSRINNNNNISSDQGEIWTSDNNNKGMLRIESSQRPTDPRNPKKLNAGNGEGEEASHKSTNKSFPSDQVSQRDTDKAPSIYYRTGARGDDQWAGLGRL